jgi:tripartite ATP-independent transporter DctP family solute receptor
LADFFTPKIMERKSASFLFVGLALGSILSSLAFIAIMRSKHDSIPHGAPQKIVLKLGHALDQTHPVHTAMAFMAQRVAELSQGSVEIQMFPNGQLGSEPECVEQAQRGALAITKVAAAAMEGFAPDMAVFGMPYLFRDETHFWNVANGTVGRELLRAGDKVGLHGLAYYDAGARNFYTVERPVLTPADLKESKIRVMSSKTARDLIVALGAGATPIPVGELYSALQQKMVNGAENNPPSYLSNRHYEVAKHYSLTEHTRVPDVLIISQKIWESLPQHVRVWVQQAADESVAYQRKLWTEKSAEALEIVAKNGVTIHRPDKKPFIEATASMYKGIEGTRLGDLVQQVRATP